MGRSHRPPLEPKSRPFLPCGLEAFWETTHLSTNQPAEGVEKWDALDSHAKAKDVMMLGQQAQVWNQFSSLAKRKTALPCTLSEVELGCCCQ